MSGSYGIPGKTKDLIIQEACLKVVQACKKAEKAAGLHVVIPTPENIQKAIHDGFTFIAIGVDTVFLNEAARTALSITKS
jgi:2-keto-3-deoxy-L-rhamnonate aldolase RhmA